MADPLLSPRAHTEDKRFEPKQKVELSEPKNDPYTYEELAEHDGTSPDKTILVAVKGTVFDVSRNNAYAQGGTYHGKDPSRALATSSLKAEDCVPDWSDLDDSQKTVLSEWFTFFSKRYNVVGKVTGATNTGG